MNLLLKIIDSESFDPQGNNTKTFHQKGGSIGRADNNDFVLFDMNKTVSKLHAFIHYRGDQYHLTDVSTNGVFFNEEAIPLSQSADNPRVIHSGDRIRLGGYLLEAKLEADAIVVTPEYQPESSYARDIETLLSSTDDQMLLPKQRVSMDNRYDGKFGGLELHNQLGIEDTTREARHVAGDLNIDDFLNQEFDITKIPSHDINDLLDIDSFVEDSVSTAATPPVHAAPVTPHEAPLAYTAPSIDETKPVSTELTGDRRVHRLVELVNQLLVADEIERYTLLAEINRLSRL